MNFTEYFNKMSELWSKEDFESIQQLEEDYGKNKPSYAELDNALKDIVSNVLLDYQDEIERENKKINLLTEYLRPYHVVHYSSGDVVYQDEEEYEELLNKLEKIDEITEENENE